MVNRYDNPAQAQFINAYAPIDFDALYRIGAANKEAVDKAEKELSDQIKEWGQFRSPSQVDTKRFYNLTLDRIAPVVEQIAKNPDMLKSAQGRAQIQSVINNTDYATLSQLKEGADALRLFQRNQAELMSRGLWNPSRNWNNVDVSNYDTKESGVLNEIAPLQYKSLGEIIRPYIEGLKPSFIAGNVNPNDPSQRLSYTKGWMAITNNDLRRTLIDKTNEILQTPQGSAWYKDIADSIMSLNPNATKQDIDNAFVNQMMQDAQYKLIASPVADEYAIQKDLLNAKYSAENQDNVRPLSIEDMLSTTYGKALEGMVNQNKAINTSYQQEYNLLGSDSSNAMGAFMKYMYDTNKDFATQYDRAVNVIKSKQPNLPEDQISTLASNFALSNVEMTDDQKKAYNKVQNIISANRKSQIDSAIGYTLQRAFNEELQIQQSDKVRFMSPEQQNQAFYTENPFTYIYTDTDGNDHMYSDAKAHNMWVQGLHAISQDVSPQMQRTLEQNAFDQKNFVSSEIGYSIDPRKLLSPKEFIFNNNERIRSLAEQANYDIMNTHLDRDTWTKDNFDIEELAAKGKFGKVSIGEIKGYIDTNGVRSYVVSVNIPYKSIDEYYARWWAVDTPENTLKNYGFTVTPGSGSDNDGVWKDGFVTVDMVLPATNLAQDITIGNRKFQKDLGVNKTQLGQIQTDDAIMQNYLNYELGIGLTDN